MNKENLWGFLYKTVYFFVKMSKRNFSKFNSSPYYDLDVRESVLQAKADKEEAERNKFYNDAVGFNSILPPTLLNDNVTKGVAIYNGIGNVDPKPKWEWSFKHNEKRFIDINAV